MGLYEKGTFMKNIFGLAVVFTMVKKVDIVTAPFTTRGLLILVISGYCLSVTDKIIDGDSNMRVV